MVSAPALAGGYVVPELELSSRRVVWRPGLANFQTATLIDPEMFGVTVTEKLEPPTATVVENTAIRRTPIV